MMKVKRFFSSLLSNWLVILGIVFLTIKILDWYNPLMDFSGRSEIIQISLGVCAVLSGIFHIFAYGRKNKTEQTPD